MSSPRASPFILELASPDAALDRVGGKGASLARLAAAGLPVPDGFHITTLAYRRFVTENRLDDAILAAAAPATPDDPATLDRASATIQTLIAHGAIPDDVAVSIREWYAGLGADDPPVAVRSSATAEDLPEMSFAGQQDTYLNVRGADDVLDAVKRCWASLWTARAIGYRARQRIGSTDVSIAVVVQHLVVAEVAGILFTANPVTGARDELMANAAWGLGEAIVGGLVTPDTLVVDKQSGAIVSHEIADKAVMTVRLSDGTREEPVPASKRLQPALEAHEAAELARLGVRIEQLYGQPMDIEWAMRDGRIVVLQARPITALPEPRTSLEWSLPRADGRYARGSVTELLPDPLSPMFATLALPSLNDAMRGLMTNDFGLPRWTPDLSRLVTVNDYAYYDIGLSASEAARVLLAVPLLIARGIGLLRRAEARWVDDARPEYARVVRAWAARDLSATPAMHLFAGAREIVRTAAQHYVAIQSGILPVAYVTEALFTYAYDRLAKRSGDPPALTFLLGFDSAPIRAEKSLYDLATWARTRPVLADYLMRATSEETAAAYGSASTPVADADAWRELSRRLGDYLDRFGHAVYDLDFAKPVPAEDPEPLLQTLRYYLAGQARSPHERQSEAARAREDATQSLLERLNWLRLRLLRPLVRTAQRYAPLREDALADVGLAWPLLRRMFREVGRRLVAAGALAERDDVFWLGRDEAEAAASALDGGRPVRDWRSAVEERVARWRRERTATPPMALPVKGGARFMGIDISRWAPARTDQAAGDTIKGVGASPGRVRGVARVILGPGEFNEMRPNDILVAKITTPAWTPLFALAAGVVTDVGGPLSHSSIVAREYHIPAVLGTGVATERIRSGDHITVDGDGGLVTIDR